MISIYHLYKKKRKLFFKSLDIYFQVFIFLLTSYKNRYVDGHLICLRTVGCQDLVYYTPQSERKTFLAECNVCILIDCKRIKTSRKWQTKDRFIFSYSIASLG